MKKYFIGLVWLIFVSLFIYVLFRTEQFLLNGTLIIGWMLFCIQITMSHFEKIYLVTKRLWFQIKNPDCIWNMQVVFKGPYNRQSLEHIENAFNSNSIKLSKIVTLSNVRKNYSVGPLRFEVAIDEDNGLINFSIHDMEVSFRRSKTLIENELARIFEIMQHVLKPDSGQYGLIIEFKGYNPYFGFFVRRLNANDVQGFHVTFKVENDRVAVTKNSIEINTDTLQHLRILSARYLTLSPAN